MRAVSATAQWTAAIRALETERDGERLFTDLFARELARPDGFALLDRYQGAGVRDFVAIRTRFFDDAIADLLRSHRALRQVVLLAAGMDARAFRLDWPDDVVVYEVDHPDLLIEKAARLRALGAPPRCARVEVGADLAGDWEAPLKDTGLDPAAATLWVIEGLMFFLTEAQAQALLRRCRHLSAVGSCLVVDLISQSLLTSAAAQVFLAALRGDGVAWRFGTDHPEAFLLEQGWAVRDIKEPGEPGAGHGRWRYPVYPRGVPSVSRSWLITAAIS